MGIGIVFAFLTVILFGSWAVPTKSLKVDPKIKAFWLTIGHFLLSVIVYCLAFGHILTKDIFFSFVAGVLWGGGILAAYLAIRHLGITRAVGIWIPVVIVVSASWGFLFFGEAKLLGTDKLLVNIFGIILLIIAALAVVFSNKGEKRLGSIGFGVLAALAVGIFHGSFFVPLRASSLPISVTFLPLAAGMVVVCSLTVLVKGVSVKTGWLPSLRMISSGLIIGAGNYLALLTIQFLGVSRGYPITQLAIIVNTLWGICLFGEVTSVKRKVLIAAGIIIAIVGVFIMNSVRV